MGEEGGGRARLWERLTQGEWGKERAGGGIGTVSELDELGLPLDHAGTRVIHQLLRLHPPTAHRTIPSAGK